MLKDIEHLPLSTSIVYLNINASDCECVDYKDLHVSVLCGNGDGGKVSRCGINQLSYLPEVLLIIVTVADNRNTACYKTIEQ